VLAVGATLTVIAAVGVSGLFSFEVLFSVTGGLYFVLYGVGVASFALLAKGMRAKGLAALGAAAVLAVTLIGGQAMWLSWAAFFLAVATVAAFNRRSSTTTTEPETIRVEAVASFAVDPATIELATVDIPTVGPRAAAGPRAVRFGTVEPDTVEFPRTNPGRRAPGVRRSPDGRPRHLTGR
jgi:hypothetical protein